jgi:hypothetical protein
LVSTITMPLGGLVSQPSASPSTLWKLTIPFSHDETAQLTLTLQHESEYAHWLNQELRARRLRNDEATRNPWMAPSHSLLKRWGVTSSTPSIDRIKTGKTSTDDNDGCTVDDEDDEDEYYLSDWVCGICYLFSIGHSATTTTARQ